MWKLMVVIVGFSSCLVGVTRGQGVAEARGLVTGEEADRLTRRTLGHHYGGGTSCMVKGSYCRWLIRWSQLWLTSFWTTPLMKIMVSRSLRFFWGGK